jgi:hypothetical protein
LRSEIAESLEQRLRGLRQLAFELIVALDLGEPFELAGLQPEQGLHLAVDVGPVRRWDSCASSGAEDIRLGHPGCQGQNIGP